MEKMEFQNIIAVTNRHLCKGDFLEQIEKICRLHPRAIILREKDLPEVEYEKLARDVLKITNQYGVECRLHFFWKTALKLNLSAIHLPLWKLEAMTTAEKAAFSMIGTSVHSLDEAKTAMKLGSSYLTAGHIYATDCKKGVPPRGLRFLKEICDYADIPVYGIGGIHFDKNQIEEVIQNGASGVCIMSGMMNL
ncbi:MAG: thiamine phosphate synthase [Lachnospiraceae bacterium]|nr:thiamine phosphate synthase [Lachnospiraceae bacterium]